MRRFLALLLLTPLALGAQRSDAHLDHDLAAGLPWPTVGTFSILGYDPATGEVGGAVQSRVFSVGNGVLWAEAGVGVAATQAIVDVSYGPQALALLRTGMAPHDVITTVWTRDPDPRPIDWTKQGRQFAVIDAKGRVAAYTGPKATEWAGDKQGAYCTAQGNILAGPGVVDSMVAAFERTTGHLSFRLLAALEAGQRAGGDKRGMQSAAMVIVKKDAGVWLHNDVVLRLQVDDDTTPIASLRRLVEKAAQQRESIQRGQQRSRQREEAYVGTWRAGATSLVIARDSASAMGGTLGGTLSGAAGFAKRASMAFLTRGDTLVGMVRGSDATFSGTLSASRDTLRATLTRAGSPMPLLLVKQH